MPNLKYLCIMDDLKSFLISQAKQKGICDDGFSHMKKSADVDALVEYYIQNPDWCLERNYPSLDCLRENFSDIADKGVFVDKTFCGDTLIDRQVYIFHNCRGSVKVGLNVDKALIPMLYFANNCDITIEGIPNPFVRNKIVVPLYIFGDNYISAPDNISTKFIYHLRDLL